MGIFRAIPMGPETVSIAWGVHIMQNGGGVLPNTVFVLLHERATHCSNLYLDLLCDLVNGQGTTMKVFFYLQDRILSFCEYE